MRILLIILFFPILVYGAGLGYLWYEVKSAADGVARQASPFAEISYGSVHVSLVGDEVGLDEVVINPTMTQDQFRIEKVRFTVPNMTYFISAGKKFEKGELPEKLGMQIGRMHLDLNSEIFSVLEQMPPQVAGTESGGLALLFNLDAFGCGAIERFTIKDYRKMGLGATVMDIGANLGYDKARDTTLVTVSANAERLNSVEFRAELKAGPNMRRTISESGIPRTTISLRDAGYYKLRNAYCADLNSSSDEAYVERNLQMISETLGATFPEEAVIAYKRYMLEGGAMEISINPPSAVDPDGLQFYSLEAIVQMLGLDLAINGQQVELNQVQWGSKPRNPVPGSETKGKFSQTPTHVAPPRPTAQRATRVAQESTAPAYKEIRVADAGKHVDSMVEVTTEDGKVRRGLLEKVADGRIYLVVRVSAGTLSYPVEVMDITRLRVIN